MKPLMQEKNCSPEFQVDFLEWKPSLELSDLFTRAEVREMLETRDF